MDTRGERAGVAATEQRRQQLDHQRCGDLDAGLITVAKQLVVDGWEVYEDDPKSDAGARTIALDSDTVQALKRYRAQQDKDREERGSAGVETGRVFTKENGEMLHPANVTRRFVELYEEIGLPPVRLHDLRHGAATLAHAAGADLKDIQEMLGHSSITITADTYMSLLPEADLADNPPELRWKVPRQRSARTRPSSTHRCAPVPTHGRRPVRQLGRSGEAGHAGSRRLVEQGVPPCAHLHAPGPSLFTGLLSRCSGGHGGNTNCRPFNRNGSRGGAPTRQTIQVKAPATRVLPREGTVPDAARARSPSLSN
ncbi:tyrosine-type recombinase/integrase [Streptomyces sp. NPDC059468]|uniref:tyrosine-type recombinase/integrase n=1 Tax=Streptomyces sp. NPDC059468 TaxID=3346845 RepID=UPI0036BB4102